MRTVLFVQISSGMGGAAHSLLLLASRLHRYGYRPIIAGQQDREGLWHEADLRGIRYYPLFLSAWARSHMSIRDLVYLPHRLNTMRRLAAICDRERVDLVHTNLQTCIDGALTANLIGVSHITHIRDEFTNPDMHRWWGGPHVATRVIANLSRRVIAISKACARPFLEDGLGQRVVVIPNAIESPTRAPSSDARANARGVLGLPADAPVVALVGQVIARKGHEEFLEAARTIQQRFPRAVFLVVGAGLPDYVEHLRNRADVLAHEGTVRFLGHQRDVWNVYLAADVVACPSWAEGFGRVAAEAMVAGKPVVGTSVGGIPDVIDDGVTGYLVPPKDADALAESIMHLLDDPDLARGMGCRGREKARRLYDPQEHVRRVVRVYEDVLAAGT